MLIKKYVSVEGNLYPVTISDDSMALSAAYVAGGAIIGIWDEKSGGQGDFSSCLYLVTSPEDVDKKMLERVVRRRRKLPWKIGETRRLLIREFSEADPLEPENWAAELGTQIKDNQVFCNEKSRSAYIDHQYRFHERGLWALVEKETGEIIGKAGITGEELGYHIYPPYRRKGYAQEALREIIQYGKEELLIDEFKLRIRKDNIPSLSLAARLGFFKIEEVTDT